MSFIRVTAIERRSFGLLAGARYASTLYVLLESNATSAVKKVAESKPLPLERTGTPTFLVETLMLSLALTVSRSVTTNTVANVTFVCQAKVNVLNSASKLMCVYGGTAKSMSPTRAGCEDEAAVDVEVDVEVVVREMLVFEHWLQRTGQSFRISAPISVLVHNGCRSSPHISASTQPGSGVDVDVDVDVDEDEDVDVDVDVEEGAVVRRSTVSHCLQSTGHRIFIFSPTMTLSHKSSCCVPQIISELSTQDTSDVGADVDVVVIDGSGVFGETVRVPSQAPHVFAQTNER